MGKIKNGSTSDGKRDPRTRELVMPTRIIWVTENSDGATVMDPEVLLREKHGQVPEGTFLDGSGCRMENKGSPASLLVDFGIELHGGLQLASGGPSGRDVKVRVRFGESVAEAMGIPSGVAAWMAGGQAPTALDALGEERGER